jgi:hypothetical protein
MCAEPVEEGTRKRRRFEIAEEAKANACTSYSCISMYAQVIRLFAHVISGR